jgi:uncharacterized Fe-S cluster protein YjdI
MGKRLQVYESAEITVTFEPTLCIHSGNCVRGLPAVFDVGRKRWVRPAAASRAEVEAQIARCPSGALKWYSPGQPLPVLLELDDDHLDGV